MEPTQGELEFKILFTQAAGMYPSSGGHEGSLPAYWAHLKRYPLPVLREAFRRACGSSAEFFPSAVRVRECADAASKTAALPRAQPERPLLEGKREYVPPIGAGAEQWVNEATGRFERLARTWMVESKHKGWDRNVEMPHEDGQRRLKEFWATWNQQEADKCNAP